MQSLRKWLITAFIPLCMISSSVAQNLVHIADSILAEGNLLYKSEVTSWYGTDAFLSRYQNRSNIGGYFSYAADSVTRCVFYSKEATPTVLGTITFNGTYSVAAAQVDLTSRSFSEMEQHLYDMRANSLKAIQSDTLFKLYKNSNLNLVPVITKDYKRVYVMTGPQENNKVLFGNDYLLTFNPDNTLKDKQKLHKGMIEVKYGQGTEMQEGGYHTHLPEYSPFITPTDICTLLLYGPFANWKQYYVVSKDYVSIYNTDPHLLIMTTEAWKKLGDAVDKKKKSK